DPPRRVARSREEIAQIEVGHTNVTPSTARWLVTVFLVFAAIPALVDLATTIRNSPRASHAWTTLAALPSQTRSAAAEAAGKGAGSIGRIRAANNAVLSGLHAFEDDLADQSPLFAALRPSAQIVLSGWLGVGNERVYQGHDGWLFYRPD